MLEGSLVWMFRHPKPNGLIQRSLNIATPRRPRPRQLPQAPAPPPPWRTRWVRWIGIEMGEMFASPCPMRLQKVVAGEQGGISAAVGWGQGKDGQPFDGAQLSPGARLGAPVFGADSRIDPVRFAALAAYIWQQETATAWDQRRAHRHAIFGHALCFDSGSRLLDGRQGLNLLKVPGGDAPRRTSTTRACRRAAKTAPKLNKLSPNGQGWRQAGTAGSTTTPPPPPAARSRTATGHRCSAASRATNAASGQCAHACGAAVAAQLHAAAPPDNAAGGLRRSPAAWSAARLAPTNVVFKHIPL